MEEKAQPFNSRSKKIEKDVNAYSKKAIILDEGVVSPFKVVPFMKFRKFTYAISFILLLLSTISVFYKGFNLGLDFTGGTVIELNLSKDIQATSVSAKVSETYPGVESSNVGNLKSLILRVPVKYNNSNTSNNITNLVKQNFDPDLTIKSVEFVGPKVGSDLINAAVYSTILTLLMILVYCSVRFQWRLSLGAVLSLAHDVWITVGVFSALQIELDLNFVAAILSVIGYSINDSIVVFSRVRENAVILRTSHIERVINVSLTQVLARTFITSGTTLIVVLALLFFGGSSLYSFSLALFIGILVGTYSSIYVAIAFSYDLKMTRHDLLSKIPADKNSIDDDDYQ